MRQIGTISMLQVQRISLKQGQRPHSYYDPAGLLAVPRLRLTPAGVVGLPAQGEPIIDIHHAEHQHSRNRGGTNGLSIGFSGHYAAMRRQYGPHLHDGIAGENIFVSADGQFSLDMLGARLLIMTATGSQVVLEQLMVAAPCVEFSQFANIGDAPLAAAEQRATLQFLDGGMRGFYGRLAGDTAHEIAIGDRVYNQ